MAELASGAVSTLLGVIGNEAVRLGRVRHDVQFIQEEMESMGSFLANLSRNSREHDEQVRTWMNQVRMLANDCNSCIDLYLYRGDPTLHLPKEGPGRCLRWAPWLLRKLVAQHRAAGQLRELKDRAQDIGNRRMRYGVEVKTEPSSSGAGQLAESSLLSATQDHEEEEEEDEYQHGGDPLKVALSMTSMRMDKEDYFQKRLDEWIGLVVKARTEGDIERNVAGKSKPLPPSIAFVVAKAEDTRPLGLKVRDVAEDYFKRAKDVQSTVVPQETKAAGADHKDAGNITIFVDVSAVHYDSVPLRPHKILCYILAELERQNGASHTQQHTPRSKWRTYIYTRITIREIKDKIEAVDVKAICNLGDDKLPDQDILDKLEKGEETHLDQLLPLLIYHSTSAAAPEKDKKIKSGVAELYNDIIKQTAKKLKQKIEEKLREQLIQKIKVELREQLKRKIEEGAGLSPELREQLKREIEEVGPSLELLEQLKRKIEEELRGQLKRKMEEGGLSPELREQLKRNIEEVSSSPELQEQLNRKIEEGGSSTELQELEYEDILKTVFPAPTSITTTTAANIPHGTSVDEEIKEMVRGVKEMLHQLHELDKPDKSPEADIQEITEKKKEEIINKIRNRLKIKMMVQKIEKCLTGDRKILLILNLVYDKYVCQWEETRNSLSLLGLQCPITGAVIVATKTTQQDKKPQPSDGSELLDHIEYSLVGLYLDNVLRNSGQHMDNDEETRQILRDILYRCESHEFSMKLFAHALYAKPKRSNEELRKLHKTLCDRAIQKSLPSMMFKFSYMELPKEYRSCLLYLAICPQGHTMRRSTLIGRWVAEGLITTKDWSWPSSVIEAEKCFDTLVARCLVCPAGIGATGKVKSCTVDKQVYGFITKIAMKQRILETRLSHHLARHFSIFSDVRLRRSETIKDFLKKSSEFSNLKVLDLEGCDCFPQNQHYLSHICRRILMLKYLSLRGTGVTSLPSEIHNLLELEVLDIRETKIHAHATRNILLPKLKRLLAGHVGSSPSSHAKPKNCLKRLLGGPVDSSSADFSSVQIPEKIEKMVGVEILSNVKPKKKRDLKDIGGLNELKKLGVVINKESHLQKLVDTISDLLNQSLRFLSITLDITRHKGTPAKLTPKENGPNVLESLSINGSTITHEEKLLPLLTKNAKQLAKVTLTDTSLSQEDLQILANLENLLCVKLRPNNTGSQLTFNQGEFKNLKKILVEGNSITKIAFGNGAASNLETIVLSSTNEVSISGVDCLQKLEELELNNITNKVVLHSLLDNAKHIAKVTLHDTLLEQGDLKTLAGNKKMHYLALFGKFYNDSELIFEDVFQKLNLLTVESSDITKISFTNSSPNLEKIIWSFKEIVSLSGINKLPALKELELNGDSVPNEVEEDIKKQKSGLDYKHRAKPKNQEENKTEPDGAARCPSLWKAKDWCWRN